LKSEQLIQRDIIKYLESIGCYVIKTIATNRSGVSDLICCLPLKDKESIFLALEVKKKGGKVSKLQEVHIRKVKEAGGVAKVVYSLDEVKELICKLNYSH